MEIIIKIVIKTDEALIVDDFILESIEGLKEAVENDGPRFDSFKSGLDPETTIDWTIEINR